MMIKNQMDFHLLVKGMPSCYDIDISWERSGRHGEIRHSVGISDFEKIRKNGYYYVDKSGLIAELLEEKSNRSYSDHQTKAFWEDSWYEHAGEFF